MLDECFERRQLRQIPPDKAKAKSSLETAKIKLAEAKGLAAAGFASMAIVNAYASMFHSCRALLYRDGVQEKSHYCLIAYVREKYAATGKLTPGLITVMDAFREQRHDVFYGFGKPSTKKADVELALDAAKKLMEEISKIA